MNFGHRQGIRRRCPLPRPFVGVAILCAAFLCGCANDYNYQPDLTNPVDQRALDEFTAGGLKSSIWRDAKGNAPTREQEEAARKKCDEDIKAASTDQIRYVPASLEDDCLVSYGWKKIPQPPEPKKK